VIEESIRTLIAQIVVATESFLARSMNIFHLVIGDVSRAAPMTKSLNRNQPNFQAPVIGI